MKAIKAKIEKLNEKLLMQIHIHHIQYLLSSTIPLYLRWNSPSDLIQNNQDGKIPSTLAEWNLNGNRAFAVRQTIYECLLEKYKT